jgi:hypothetical protein
VSNVAGMVLVFFSGPAWALLLTRLPVLPRSFHLRWAQFDGTGLIIAVFLQDWRNVAVWAASGVLALILWWWSRRKRRKGALKALGHKARARLAALVENMPKPGPVLRPVPQPSPS